MLFFETLDEVPEQYRADYVESEFEGKKGFQHKGVVSLANAYRSEREKRGKMEMTLTEQEAKKQQELEQAREEERQKALDSNNVKRLLEIEAQKTADAVSKAKQEGKAEALKEIAADRAKERKQNLVERFKQKGVSDSAKTAMAIILEKMIEVDPETGSETIFDLNGKAMAVTIDTLEAEIEKMPVFEHLIEKKQATKGAGGANGYGNAGTVQKKFNEMTGGELAALRKQNPAEYERLKAEYQARG